MKRIIAILSILFVVLTVFTSCKDKAETKDTEITQGKEIQENTNGDELPIIWE